MTELAVMNPKVAVMNPEEHWLLARIARYGDRTALIWEENGLSYKDLKRLIDKWRGELRAREVRPGECVAICGDYSPETCALLIALIVERAVAVPLTGNTEQQRSEFMGIANVTSVFEFENGRPTGFSRRPSSAEAPLLAGLRERGSPGLILFSSGSTGKSKASLLDFELILKKFKEARRSYRTLTFLLLDHIGGINTLFYILTSGGTIAPTSDRRVEAICGAIERHKVELLPTTPTFLKMFLISEAHKQHDLSSLKMITYGTEPMPASTLEHLHRVLPDVELKQTYGLSELGILQTKSKDSGSLWVKVGGDGYQIKIVDNVLWIKSESAMLGYLNAPSPFDEEGWFNTSDVVEVDGEYMRILGRKSELINVGGEKVYPAEVESVLMEMDNVLDVAVIGKPNPITGQVVTAKISLQAPERREDLVRRMRAYCKGRLAPYKIPVAIEVTDKPLHGDRFKKSRLQ